MTILWKEWFWSERSARQAAERLNSRGYFCNVRYAMDASGRHDWLLEAY